MNNELLENIAEITIAGRILKAIQETRTFEASRVIAKLWKTFNGEMELVVISNQVNPRLSIYQDPAFISQDFELGETGQMIVDEWEMMHGENGWVLGFMKQLAKEVQFEELDRMVEGSTVH